MGNQIKSKQPSSNWNVLANPIHEASFKDWLERKNSIYFFTGGRGSGKSELMYTMQEALLRGANGYPSKILVIRMIKKKGEETLFNKMHEIVTKRVGGIFEKEAMSRGEMRVVCPALGGGKMVHTILVEGLRSDMSNAEKFKGLSGYTDIFIDELKEDRNPRMFRQLLTTIDRGFQDEATGIWVKPVLVACFNTPERNHWINKNWYDLEPSEVAGYDILKAKTGLIGDPEMGDLTFEDIGFHHNFSTIFDNQIFKDLTIKNAGEKRWKQTLYLNYTGFKETDPYTYYTETLGLVASGRSGRIFTDWKKIKFKEWEEISGDLFYGVDFGYAEDETTLTAIKWVKKDESKEELRDKLYIHTLVYERKLLNFQFARKITELVPNYNLVDIYSDQNPSAIDEIKGYGINIKRASKGAGSRSQQVSFLTQFEVYYTEESNWRINGEWRGIDNEIENYFWIKNSKEMTEPSNGNDHIIDGIRYACYNRIQNKSFISKFADVFWGS